MSKKFIVEIEKGDVPASEIKAAIAHWKHVLGNIEVRELDSYPGEITSIPNQNISSRDYFAGLAMQALLIKAIEKNGKEKEQLENVPHWSYQFADGMLEESNKKSKPDISDPTVNGDVGV